MISIRTWMTLFIALCAPSLAHAQSTTPTGDLSPIAPLYAQNDPSHTGKQKDEKKEKKADKKPKKADKKQSKSGDVKKSSKKNAPLSREELLTDIVNRLDDVTKAYGAGQKGTAVVLCREIIADLTPIIDDTHAIQIALACGSLFAENDLNDEELALYEQLEKRDLTPEMKSKICLAKSTVLTKMLRYEDAKSLMLTCPKHEPFDQMIEGNLAELYMTMGDLQSSIDAYRKVTTDNPKSEHALYGLASALARNGQWHDALDQFMLGVKRDPGITFIKTSFFVPKPEGDYQNAFIQLATQRYDEAKFYLKRYIKGEERLPYKAVAACALDKLEKSDVAKREQYPVLLRKVRSAAIDASARYIAFVNVDFGPQKQVKSELWVLDTQTGKTHKAIAGEDDLFVDAKFIDDTSQLRILGLSQRYELDAAQPQKGYYIFENISNTLPLALMPSATDIMSLTTTNKIALSPWNFDNANAILTSAPSDSVRFALLYDHNTVAFASLDKTTFVSLAAAKNAPNEATEIATLPMQFDVRKIASHPNKPIFALAIQSGTLLVDEKGSPITLIGSPTPDTGTEVVDFDPTGKWLLSLSENTVEIRSVNDVLAPPTAQWTCSAQTPLTIATRKP